MAALEDFLTLLTRVRRRWHAARALRLAAAVAGVGAASLLLVVAVDRLLLPGDGWMVGLAAAAVLATGAVAVRALWRLRTRPDDRQVARYIEERCPDLQDHLTSAADVLRGAGASPFRELVLGAAGRRAREVDPRLVVTRAALRRRLGQAAAAAAVLLLVLAGSGEPLGRLGRTAWLYAFPHTVSLHVEPGDARVPVGAALRLSAQLDDAAGVPPRTPPAVVLTGPDGRPETREMTIGPGGAYQLDIPSVADSFTYRVRAAALVAGPYEVTALHAPRVERIDVAYRYPPTTALPPRMEVDGGDVLAPPGTRVTVTARLSKPVEQAALLRAAGGRTTLVPAGDPAALAGTFEVTADDTYRIEVVDADGLRNPDGADYFIRVRHDQPPAVQIVRPGGDRDITSLEEVVVEARAEDDFGVRGFDLVYQMPGGPERVAPLAAADGAARVSGRHTIHAEQLPLEPGDFLTYHVRARDTAGAEARSDIYFLEVRPFAREFQAARSQDAGGMPADELGRLAELQKEIVVATWKLDGQPQPERLAADLETVADAQNDVALAARVLTRRLRPPAPAVEAGDDAAQPVLEALEAAVGAMDAAEAELRAGRTAAAVPHEVAALDHLLDARDQTGPTQVQTDSRGGSGAGQGAQEDLSALFDRELRRDQQTNYEHRPQPEQGSAETDEDDALRQRLADLARRQQDLARRQQALAEDAPTADEQTRRRMLERLAREQEQLREQVEALGGELSRADRQPAAGTRDTQAAREAAGEMRQAADALGRGDPAQAADRGRQALDALRALGRRLGAGSAQAGEMDELQMEAQQLAGLQRQLAEEAGRAQQAAAGERGARRLSERQQRLADRVEALSDRLEAVRPAATDDERAAIDRAAQALAAEDTARRMRETADQWRQSAAQAPTDTGQDADAATGGPQPDPAAPDDAAPEDAASDAASQAARQLAAVLERAAGELASADAPSGDEGQQLAAELAAAQELRRRLEEIGQRASAAAPGAGAGRRLDTSASAPGAGIDDLLEQLAQARPDLRPDLEAWARQWRSGPAPGTDSARQDLSAWASLYSELQVLIDDFEVSRAQRLSAEAPGERPGLGPGQHAPAAYRPLIDEYYRLLAERQLPDGAAPQAPGKP